MIVCYSRCLICGRRTPHVCCHRHSIAINGLRYWPKGDFNRNQGRMYTRHFNDEPEMCEDATCPAREGERP